MEGYAMSTFDLTPRLAHESKGTGKGTILFDRTLPDHRHPNMFLFSRYVEGNLTTCWRTVCADAMRESGKEPMRTCRATDTLDVEAPHAV